MKIILADLKGKINFLGETHCKNKRPMLTGRQVMYQMFSFFNINKTQEHRMNATPALVLRSSLQQRAPRQLLH